MNLLHLLASHKASGGQGHLSPLTSDPQLQLCAGDTWDALWQCVEHTCRCKCTNRHACAHPKRHTHLITLPAIMQYSDRQVLSQTIREHTACVCHCVCVVSSVFLLQTALKASPYVWAPCCCLTLQSACVCAPLVYLCANKRPMESRRLQAVICSCECLLLQQSSGFCATTKGDLLWH